MRAELTVVLWAAFGLLLAGCPRGQSGYDLSKVEICELSIGGEITTDKLKICSGAGNLQWKDTSTPKVKMGFVKKHHYQTDTFDLRVGVDEEGAITMLMAKQLNGATPSITESFSLGDSVSSCSEISPELSKFTPQALEGYICVDKDAHFEGRTYRVQFSVSADGKLIFFSAIPHP